MSAGLRKTKPGVHKLTNTTRFLVAHGFVGKRVAVTRTWAGGSEIWQGKVVDVARSNNGSTTDLMVIHQDGQRFSDALSLAQVYAIEEIEEE